LDLQIVNLSKKYAWHRAPRDVDDDEPELGELEQEAPAHEIEPGSDRWALRGINAVIKPGERVGIIGANGAGKTTLLNILAGITLPSGGYVRGRGLRILLNSLRTPFRGQLTGRQNLHILAALLGVEADRLEARIPEILAFSGMEDFIDRRVLYYSTQQYRRLTFAAALMLEPEIILSDDTLGIGDARYQQKTEQLIAEKVEKDGVIFMLASNRLNTIQDLCTRVIWLEDGRVAADGPAEEVIEAFIDTARRGNDEPAGEVEMASSVATPSSVADPALWASPPAAAEASAIPEAVSTAPPADALAAEQPSRADDLGPSGTDFAADLPPRDDGAEPVPSEEIPIGAEDVPLPPSRAQVPEWSRLAQNAVERRKIAERERIEKWTKTDRKWLWTEMAFPRAPGLGELVDIRLDLGDGINGNESSLQIAVRLEKPGTEVSVLVDGVLGQTQTHIYSAELPAPLLVPASGLYFFTVNIDDVLLQPRVLDQPYTKTKLRVKVYLRAADSAQWKLLSGMVRVLLPGDGWNPRLPYPEGYPGPVLMPSLRWNVEICIDDSSAAGGPEPASDDKGVLVGSQRRDTVS
jgi:ABC-type polysaccharide/polyol phosphate transport system ATPase subunit